MKLDTLKKRLQQHFTDGLVMVVGSGLSCAEGLPGMDELAANLCCSLSTALAPAEAMEWAEIEPLIKAKGLEVALLEKVPTSELEAAIAVATARIIGDRERAVISEIFEGTRTLRLTRLVPYLLKPTVGLPIITTNYDRLVEVAIEEAGLGVDTMFVGRFAGMLNERESRLSFCRRVSIDKKHNVSYTYQTRALVYKPHGSLDWYLRKGRPVHYAGDLPDATRLIITPGRNKFRTGYDSPFDTHRDRANRAIDNADRFLIVGYGFNDDHLETHLSPAIRSGKSTLMLTYSLTDVAKRLAENHANVIALEQANQYGMKGTRVIADKSTIFYPGLHLWDVASFVKEVLEP